MKHELEELAFKTVKSVFQVDIQVILTRPDEQFGDYTTNVALQIAQQIKQNPHEVAETLAAKLKDEFGDKVSNLDVAGPGFINIYLQDKTLIEAASMSGITKLDKKIVIETNNPNPFKDLHIGHAYNSILADTIANLLEVTNSEVHRVSYHGDVGLHVGKSMWAILKYADGDLNKLEQIPESERPNFLSEKYAEGSAAYETDDLAKQEIEKFSKESFKLEDAFFKDVYELCKSWSFTYIDEILGQIGNQKIEKRYLERETDQVGREVVEAHIGDVFERSEGAVIFPGEKYGLHTRVFISSRGTTLYEARDIGLIKLKQNDFSPTSSYIITAEEQKEYFRVVFKAVELALPELTGITQNISMGTVKLSTGKMSSRTGNVINIGWLFEEIGKALRTRGATEESLHHGLVGALRYSMLKVSVGSDIVFDIDEAISLEGNSGPYLQYAHARARSIISKSKSTPDKANFSGPLEPNERALVYKIGLYGEVIEKASSELKPHHICTYLFELAQSFNRFYEHNTVIGDPRESQRLSMVQMYADSLKAGLQLLGIPAPDHM
jgi:arginyl-tRNA synthetase